MKKIVLSLMGLVVWAASWAAGDKLIRFEELPEAARATVNRYFDADQVASVKQEYEWLGSVYEVKFYDGTEIDFLGNGEWKEIDCTPRALPAGLVPSGIARLIEKRFPERKVVKIERDRRDWEVELDDGTDLKFDLQFNLIDIDR
ncbi:MULTISPECIES: PepSY-like domain-containing protein [Rikenellaceae]|uniref:PepSY-like domain-containing protein n=1 Tax=Rikenellaceae TaxID=171550 RepID=UPI0025CD590A|nr:MULTISPECIES: PepSY-like domain-containing protein [Rikenellaceae]